MNKLYIILAVGAFLLAAAGLLLSNKSTSAPTPIPQQAPTQIEASSVTAPASTESGVMQEEGTITYSDLGFAPSTLTVKKGTAVTFKNISPASFWPASAIHPSHRAYPNSDIAKCNTPDEKGIFDACRQVASGKSWSFTFNETGTWKYHDHLNPSLNGTLVVE